MLTNIIAKLTGEKIVPLTKGSRSRSNDQLTLRKKSIAGKPRKRANQQLL
jgi:hypothetical protein